VYSCSDHYNYSELRCQMKTPRTLWDDLLKLATVIVGVTGLFFVGFGPATQELFKRLIYGTAPDPVVGVEALTYVRFVYGVLGAVMFGWALALWFIITGPFRERQRWAWNAVVASMMGWFVVDTTLSLLSGYGENAILNLAFAVMFAVPLYLARADFQTAGRSVQPSPGTR
jgi:hypothetical protein